MLVVGVDGCKKGWVAMATKDGKVHEARVFSEFRELTDAYRNAKVIAVDIPIGLPKQSHREADLTARELLGKRRSSLFLTPPRPVLAVPTYPEARKVAQKMGWTVTAQAHGLNKKILEVESFAARDKRIFEAHPLFLSSRFGPWRARHSNGVKRHGTAFTSAFTYSKKLVSSFPIRWLKPVQKPVQTTY